MYGLLISQPSAYELHLRTRREQRLAINALLRHAASKFAKWIFGLVSRGASIARRMADERRLSRAMRVLQALQDRELSDMGLVRSEIEHFVRHGRTDATDPRYVLSTLWPSPAEGSAEGERVITITLH
jgi:uncharacterized protein YjiS (DUF1127 family)